MNQREAFEKWAKQMCCTGTREKINFSRVKYDEAELYEDKSVEVAWAAWQAATAIARESCAKVCDHYATAIDLRGNEYIRSGDCKRAAELIRDRK